jgi:hypothetical protein
MIFFGNCRQVVSEIVVYVFLLYMMNFGNCLQAEHSTIVCFLFYSTYCTFTARCKRSTIIQIIQVRIALFLLGVYMKAFIFRSAV